METMPSKNIYLRSAIDPSGDKYTIRNYSEFENPGLFESEERQYDISRGDKFVDACDPDRHRKSNHVKISKSQTRTVINKTPMKLEPINMDGMPNINLLTNIRKKKMKSAMIKNKSFSTYN